MASLICLEMVPPCNNILLIILLFQGKGCLRKGCSPSSFKPEVLCYVPSPPVPKAVDFVSRQLLPFFSNYCYLILFIALPMSVPTCYVNIVSLHLQYQHTVVSNVSLNVSFMYCD